MNKLQLADYIVFFIYFIAVSSYGYYIYHKKKSATASSKDFFLAEGSLTWWAIGASLSASNISGFAFAGSVGLRAEFYKRVFISLEQLGGVIAQNNRNFSNDFLKEMKQNIGFGQTNLSLGFFLFYKGSDECNTCPKW